MTQYRAKSWEIAAKPGQCVDIVRLALRHALDNIRVHATAPQTMDCQPVFATVLDHQVNAARSASGTICFLRSLRRGRLTAARTGDVS